MRHMIHIGIFFLSCCAVVPPAAADFVKWTPECVQLRQQREFAEKMVVPWTNATRVAIDNYNSILQAMKRVDVNDSRAVANYANSLKKARDEWNNAYSRELDFQSRIFHLKDQFSSNCIIHTGPPPQAPPASPASTPAFQWNPG
jgi:hypothetical protein